MTAQTRYLLDTNIISELVRRPRGVVTARIGREGDRSICTSIIVAVELRFGAEKSGSEKLRSQLEAILSAIEILLLEEPADRRYAVLRAQLEKAETSIGPNDMLIAAQALSLGLTVVTGNQREFGRVLGLSVENWLED